MSTDRRYISTAALLRAIATGYCGLLLGLHLTRMGTPPQQAGLVVASGLLGAAVAGLGATLAADRLGRRRCLVALAVCGAAGAMLFPLGTAPSALAAAAGLGMLNGMGRDRGAALILEQAALPATTSDAGRTRAFAVYNVLQDAGHALGSLLAGLALGPAAGFGLLALLLLAPAPLYARLSAAVEAPATVPRRRLSPASRRIVWHLAALFGLDSLAGGLLTTALLTVFLQERFGAGPQALAALFFGARAANAASHVAAAWLARRIGLVNTMVFTHVPSSLLLVTVAFAPSFPVAAALFLLREGLVEMDVPTRQSYVMALVRPEERTLASGLTHLVRLGAWAVGPAFAGLFMQRLSLWMPLVAGAAMKLAYDAALYVSFRGIVPPEEAPKDTEPSA
jgi:MFS family permease